MRYVLWIGLAGSLILATLGSDPLWPLLLCAGIAANGLVCGLNGWKMPVRRRIEEGPRHTPMTAATRLKWLGDVIPTGFGLASIGDFLLWAGMLGILATWRRWDYVVVAALMAFSLWVVGWSRGFNLSEKWTPEERKDSRKNLPIVLVLMILGNLLGVRGCGISDLKASAKQMEAVIAPAASPRPVKPASKWRSLGTLASPPAEILTRLRKDTAKRDRDAVLKAIAENTPQATVLANGQAFFTMTAVAITPKSARSGPFCRVTCAAHHGGQYDVETAPELCTANWIPKTAEWVPGWQSVQGSPMEFRNPWPGPASEGFESYKLYWSSLQSEAKVLHAKPEKP